MVENPIPGLLTLFPKGIPREIQDFYIKFDGKLQAEHIFYTRKNQVNAKPGEITLLFSGQKILAVNINFRDDLDKIHGLEDCMAIGQDDCGRKILISINTGKVYVIDLETYEFDEFKPGALESRLIADSFSEFIKMCKLSPAGNK